MSRPAGARSTAVALAILWLGLVVGCKVGPDYTPPETEMPDVWNQELTRGLAEGEANLETWWTTLNDPVLDGLIQRAIQGNLDLKAAVARVVASRARLGIASGDKFPSVDTIGSYQRTRISEEIVAFPGLQRTDDNFQAGFDMAWEIDVFGRVRRSIESADASLDASVESYRDVLVTLLAEVALNYIDVRSLQARLRFAASNVVTQRGTLQLTTDRLQAQLVPELDVRQAELNLASTESVIPSLRIGLTQAINRLGVLLGERPSALHEELAADIDIPDPPAEIVIGLPAELLRQRPDVRRAERELAAQTAQIGVATADLYPRFSLTGTFTLASHDGGTMWDQGARQYSYGPQMSWNFFDGGRIRNNIKAEDALAVETRLRYEQTVLFALQEVEDAIVAFRNEMERRDALERTVVAAQASVVLVQTLYRTGLTDFQNVLDMERSLFVQQDLFAESEGRVVQDLILIYKALGGGWDAMAAEPDDESADTEIAAEAEISAD
jgi:NodT family efflux transporter outer membrane factor (OMF) lipoprotein